MDILYLLIPLSALMVLAILGVFAWALHGGQFDDLERVVDLVAVGQQLRLAPGFAGVAQDVDEILPRFRGELDR